MHHKLCNLGFAAGRQLQTYIARYVLGQDTDMLALRDRMAAAYLRVLR